MITPCKGSKIVSLTAMESIIIIIIIIIMKKIIMIMMIALKNSPHCAANRLQHVRSSGPGAIVCKSRASSAYHVQRVVLRAT